jgi:acetylornithine/succinyldiaminopimelate/putrescine aminotransferase
MNAPAISPESTSAPQQAHRSVSCLMPTYAPQPVAFVRGEGVWLFDAHGKRYLDGLSGI